MPGERARDGERRGAGARRASGGAPSGARPGRGRGDAPGRGLGAVTEARRAAADICADLREGALLDPVFERRTLALDPRDRRWTRELVYGMLRRRAVLDRHLDVRVKGGIARIDPDLTDLLRLGAAQLLHMGSVPPYAAIGQTVELVKDRHGIGASKLANAVLRRLDREREALALPDAADTLEPLDTEGAVEALSLRASHPSWLVARWAQRWGVEDTARLLEANNHEAPLVLRPWRVTSEALARELLEAGIETRPAPLLPDGLEVTSPVAGLTELEAFRQGRFHVQDPASTLVTRYAALSPGSTVADLCAAPGGKAMELSRVAGRVLASDVSPSRIGRVRENVLRLGARNVFAAVADARFAAAAAVDAVLIDVPCTGTGTFRRHPDARWRLRISDLAMLGMLQKQILRAAARLLPPGGLLVYSTCSLELEENDVPVDAFLAESPGWRLEPPPSGAVPEAVLDAGRLRVLPQRHGTDGAFAARLRRVA